VHSLINVAAFSLAVSSRASPLIFLLIARLQVPGVLAACTPELLNTFKDGSNQLEQVEKGLEQYLETKRKAFPRFYFLSSQDLIDIISQTKDPTRVQEHLIKCFEAIKSVTFEADREITAMVSREDERVPFVEGMYPEGQVEFWLKDVERSMQVAIRDQLLRSIREYPTMPRTKWVLQYPGQVVLAGSQVHWTREIELAFTDASLPPPGAPDGTAALPARGQGLTPHQRIHREYERQVAQLRDLTILVREKLSALNRSTLGALITIDVHARDVTEALDKKGIESIGDFEWISQLRYYWEDDECHVKMVQTDFPVCFAGGAQQRCHGTHAPRTLDASGYACAHTAVTPTASRSSGRSRPHSHNGIGARLHGVKVARM